MLLYVRRIGLFLMLNFIIVISFSLFMSLFNIQPYITKYGLNIRDLAIYCFSWGIIGSFVSLLLSKITAKWILGVNLFKENVNDPKLQFVYRIVEKQAQILGLKMPEVGVFETEIVNAFATGPSKSNSLVAVSRGLLNNLNSEEIEAVLGHEMSHIANGDMVTMTLLQGIVNAFVMFLSRILAFAISNSGDKNKNESRSSNNSGFFYLLTFLFEIVFMIIGSLIIAAYSRFREYRADYGGALLSSKKQMIGALKALERIHDKALPEGSAESLAAFMIRGNRPKIFQFFASHPPIEKRIERLQDNLQLQ